MTAPARPRVLHLGYEDPAKPGSGGGAVRTHEVNSRLAEEFDVTVVSARFPGCRTQTRGGVTYTHAGWSDAYAPAVMSYFAVQTRLVQRYRPDLVVEDFGAPISTWGLPRTTRVPVVGVVQWLFARDKARQYRLPLRAVEDAGLRAHRTLVAVSDDLGAELRTRNPAATVHVVHNGLPADAFVTPPGPDRRHVRYLGRLEDAQKGVGLLLDAWARAVRAGRVPAGTELQLGGSGPDEAALVAAARRLGVDDSVRFVGPVRADRRFAWLADAALVAMPSRYETFGMVAAESLAVRTPVVAFDIACLRSLVDDRTGRTVPAFDVDAYAAALGDLLADPDGRDRLGAAGRDRVGPLTWDAAAQAQAAVYREAMARRRDPRG